MPPVLVAHSMGGYVAKKYLESRSAAAGVLLASVAVSGLSGFVFRSLRRHPWAFLKTQVTLNPWHLVGTPALARDAFFSASLPAEQFERHWARLQPESMRVMYETLLLNLPRPQQITTPMLVLAAANDTIFSVAEERGM